MERLQEEEESTDFASHFQIMEADALDEITQWKADVPLDSLPLSRQIS